MRYRSLILLLGLLAALPAAAEQRLTLQRIFSSPDLAGATLRQPELSPDGTRVTFLRGREEDRNLLDLWEYNVADDEQRVLIAADDLVEGEVTLSEAEQARRERERIADLRGIVDYRWSTDGAFLLFPIGGDIYLRDMRSADGPIRKLTDSESFDSDPQIAPGGEHVAFVRDRDLWLVDVESGEARPLTDSASDTVANGVAEFIAQEEMGRSTGFWWSPRGEHIAFLQIDEAPVEITRRYEVEAEAIEIVEQRYPYAGTDNVTYRLGVVGIASGDIEWMDIGEESDIYIPRVDWLPNGVQLSFQRQSRDQQTLELVVANIDSGEARTLLTERSDTWVNLHDDLHFLSEMPAFVWSSERDGYRHLYLYDYEGELIRRLTDGDWQVDALAGVDEELGMVYFTASESSPAEKQFYRQSLITRSPEAVSRVSKRSGWHEVNMDRQARVYVDTYSNSEQPPQLSLHNVDGQRLAWLVENAIDDSHPYAPFRSAHRPTEFGELVAPQGHRLSYRITRPADFDPDRRYPVFIHVYGGPTGQMVTDRWGRRILVDQYMAQRGYVVFSLDNRGVERYGKAFQDAAYLKLGRIEMPDQMVGVDWLRGQPFVDPERIGIFGWSYGGYMSLMALGQYPGEFEAAVSVAPVTDWSLYDTHYTERYMGRPANQPEAYRQGNVLTYADAMEDELLLIHGMADDNVLFTHSTKLMHALQGRAFPFDLMTYPGEKHAISGEGPRLHVYRTLTQFLDRHLLGADSVRDRGESDGDEA
jgi:dipeptidyl-peptidase-4